MTNACAFRIILLTLIVSCINSCASLLTEEIDFEAAETLIQSYQLEQQVDSSLFHDSNAEQFIPGDSEGYLFVINSFNGEYNEYYYSPSGSPPSVRQRFGKFYIKSMEATEGNWTMVYGSW